MAKRVPPVPPRRRRVVSERQLWVWRRNAAIQGMEPEAYVALMLAQRELPVREVKRRNEAPPGPKARR